MLDTKSFTTSGLVLKRKKTGEADSFITLLTKDMGKIVCRAKGGNKLTSHKLSVLEAGNIVTAHCVITKAMPLITQAKVEQQCREQLQSSLSHYRSLQQILELFDALFIEDAIEEHVFQLMMSIYQDTLAHIHPGQIRQQLDALLHQLGYPLLVQTPFASIQEHVSHITERKLHSFVYMTVQS